MLSPLVVSRLLPFVLIVLGTHLPAGETVAAPAFALTDDARCRQALQLIWDRQPKVPAMPVRMHRWFAELARAADQMRWYRLAEAVQRESLVRWPVDGPGMANLSCFVGKQGRFQEAFDLATKAAEDRTNDRDRAIAISATWAWHLGRKEEAGRLLTKVERPGVGKPGDHRWLACRAVHLATTTGDETELKDIIAELTRKPTDHQWMTFLRRDVAFDRYRQLPWFVAAVGATAVVELPKVPIPTISHAPDEDAMIAAIPHSKVEVEARVHIDLAAPLVSTGKWDEALAHLGKIRANPLPVEAILIEAYAWAGKGQAKRAMNTLRRVSHEGHQIDSLTTDTLTIETMSNATLGLLVDRARKDRSQSLALAIAINVMAHVFWSFRDYDEMIKILDQAQNWAPQLAETYNLRGIARSAKGEFDLARADYERAAERDPAFADPLGNLAHLEFWAGNFEAALRYQEKAAARAPEDVGKQMTRAEILSALDRVDEAIAILDKLSGLPPPTHPDLPLVAWEVSSRCAQHRKFVKAEAVTRLVIQLCPEITRAWTKLSGDLFRQGRYDEARKAVKTALDQGPPDAVDACLQEALCLLALGQGEEARKRIADVVLPAGDVDRMLYHSGRAVFGAVSKDVELMKSSLTELMMVPPLANDPDKGWAFRWLSSEILFDPFRGEPWFGDLLKQAERREMKQALP